MSFCSILPSLDRISPGPKVGVRLMPEPVINKDNAVGPWKAGERKKRCLLLRPFANLHCRPAFCLCDRDTHKSCVTSLEDWVTLTFAPGVFPGHAREAPSIEDQAQPRAIGRWRRWKGRQTDGQTKDRVEIAVLCSLSSPFWRLLYVIHQDQFVLH